MCNGRCGSYCVVSASFKLSVYRNAIAAHKESETITKRNVTQTKNPCSLTVSTLLKKGIANNKNNLYVYIYIGIYK